MWSFDIFDTCLVRRHAFPTDLFLDLADCLRHRLQPAVGNDYREVFREARIEANRLALTRTGHEEVNLREIWDALVNLLPGLDAEEGMTAEMATESMSLRPITYALELVAKARQVHSRVAFISDTYLPNSFISEQLTRHGFLQAQDEIILSNDLRATKHSGRLFHLALGRLGINADELVHHGDNIHSDVKMAKAAGIRTVHLPQGALSARECNLGSRIKHLDTGITSELLGSMRLSRLMRAAAAGSAQSLAYSFIGPFLVTFAGWLLKRAANDGIKRLYFFSRDCHALHRVASILAERWGLGIDCRYLKVSRQALLLPAADEISAAAMPWLRRSWEQGDLGSTLAKLDLDTPDAYAALSALPCGNSPSSILKGEDVWKLLWEKLGADPLRGMVLSRIAERRAAALGFLRQEGLLDSEPAGIVDLGWLQSGHSALVKLLRIEAPLLAVPGYYLGLNGGRGSNITGCPAQALFHEAPHDRRAGLFREEVFQNVHVLEHVLNCAPHGSIDHYEKQPSGEFVAYEKPCTPSEHAVKSALLREVEQFTRGTTSGFSLTDSEARTILTAILSETVTDPSSEWVEVLRHLEVSNDQNSRDATSLVKPRSVSDAILDGLKGRRFASLKTHQRGYWPEISYIASPKTSRRIYRTVDLLTRGKRFILG